MKIKLLILFILGLTRWVYPQTFEKEIHGVTYVFNQENKEVENKANTLMDTKLKVNINECPYFLNSTRSQMYAVYRKVFSKATRVKELIGGAIGIFSIFDSSGNVLEVKFHSFNLFDKITLEEIYQLEKCLKEEPVSIKVSCPDIKYYRGTAALNFERLYKYYDND